MKRHGGINRRRRARRRDRCVRGSLDRDRSLTPADLIAQAYERYRAAEHAYYDEFLFLFLVTGIDLTSERTKALAELREAVFRARTSYFAALIEI
jgi:hypothetical protein